MHEAAQSASEPCRRTPPVVGAGGVELRRVGVVTLEPRHHPRERWPAIPADEPCARAPIGSGNHGGHRKVGVDLADVPECGVLQIQHRLVVGRVVHLQQVATRPGVDPEVAVALPVHCDEVALQTPQDRQRVGEGGEIEVRHGRVQRVLGGHSHGLILAATRGRTTSTHVPGRRGRARRRELSRIRRRAPPTERDHDGGDDQDGADHLGGGESLPEEGHAEDDGHDRVDVGVRRDRGQRQVGEGVAVGGEGEHRPRSDQVEECEPALG